MDRFVLAFVVYNSFKNIIVLSEFPEICHTYLYNIIHIFTIDFIKITNIGFVKNVFCSNLSYHFAFLIKLLPSNLG